MAAKLPLLSASGWSNDIAEKADILLSYYFISEFSQSNLYRGEISSLPYRIRQSGHDDFDLRQAVRGDLEKLIGRYFDLAEVTVRTDLPVPGDENRINLQIDVIVVQDGKRYSLGRLITTINSRIVEIVDINNNKGD